MREYNLQIAQPSLVDSYFSWKHTLYDPYCRLRFTNLVEMMIPCFSQNALRKVLPTFIENNCGWGTETHWPFLIDSNRRDMAIIDEVKVRHTRPVQSGTSQNHLDLEIYLKKYKLIAEANEYGVIKDVASDKFLFTRNVYLELKDYLIKWISLYGEKCTTMGLDGIYGKALLLSMLFKLSHAKIYSDAAIELISNNTNLGNVKEDFSLSTGIIGCAYVIERMSQLGIIKQSDEILSNLDDYIICSFNSKNRDFSMDELASIGKYSLLKLKRISDQQYIAICDAIIPIFRNFMFTDDMSQESTFSILSFIQEARLLRGSVKKQLVDILSRNQFDAITRLQITYLLYLSENDDFMLRHIREVANKSMFHISNFSQALMLADLMTVRL